MTRRQLVAGGKRLGRDWAAARMDRDVDHRDDSKHIFAGDQWHARHQMALRSTAGIKIGAGNRLLQNDNFFINRR
jgi:hypothetical protein